MNKRIFFVSKKDENKLKFIDDYLSQHNVSNVFIICEEKRRKIFDNIDAFIVGFKDLNKSENWIRFVNDLNSDTLLIVDNVVKFMFFGDGKKKYIKELSQSINYKIMLDAVPFFTEPYEMFYPFWFLGKEILGYNNLSSFKANHFEEREDLSIGRAHDFETLKEKIKDHYIQDYERFFKERVILGWSMSDSENIEYESKKENALNNFNNPIKLTTHFADFCNLSKSKMDALGFIYKKGDIIVLNYMPYKKHINKYLGISPKYLSFHEKDPSVFKTDNRIIFYESPIVKPHNAFYIEPNIRSSIIHVVQNIGIDKNLFNRVYDNKLRVEFNKTTGHALFSTIFIIAET